MDRERFSDTRRSAHKGLPVVFGIVRRFRYVLCDVFTDVPLAGNQLAVFTDARDLTSEEMQQLARETKLSETVFVLPPSSPEADVRIRIFTPAVELPFAGHPTLGTAFVLAGPLSKIVIRLETGAGVVPVELDRDGPRIVFGRMEQPIPVWETVSDAESIFAALGVRGSSLPVERYDLGPGHVYVALESADEVAALQPDIAALARATQDGVNAFARDGAGWKTRMFAPNHGVDEDPATGSAAGPLAIHLARHGRIGFGEQIEISQGAEIDRPSKLYAEVHGSPDEIERVVVGGSAVTVARGEFSF
jgi:trans-2,3-dihydro-3-hydroxyanthranilate isomerase